MVLIPLRQQQSGAGRTPAFGCEAERRPKFGFQNPARLEHLGRVLKNESGVATIEYALIAALIVLAIVAGVGGLGGKVSTHWNNVSEAVEEADAG